MKTKYIKKIEKRRIEPDNKLYEKYRQKQNGK
jgi:hypothetical protein